MRQRTVVDLFERQVKETPRAISLIQDDRNMTFEELDWASNKMANLLIKRGVQKGDFVGFILDRSIEQIVTILAIIKTGGVHVPIDYNLPEERIVFILDDTKAPFVITDSEHKKYLPRHEARTIVVDKLADELSIADKTQPVIQITPDDLFEVIYTSGSTGMPKGVIVRHKGVVRIAKDMGHIDFSQPQVFLLQAQISFDLSTYEIWTPLLHGARLAIAPPEKSTPESIVAAIQKYEVTVLAVTAGLFHLLIEERLQELARLRYFIGVGDVMLPELVKKAQKGLPHVTILNGYGPTENTVYTTVHVIKPKDLVGSTIPIGKLVPATTTHIVDKHLRPVTKGQPGELLVGGDGVADGYLNLPKLTREKFIPNPLTHDEHDVFYRTGDLVREGSDGIFEFFGRIDQQVKIRGFRVELGEIENTIIKLKIIKYCAAVVQEIAPTDKRIVVYLVPQKGNSFSLMELKRFVEKNLPDYMRPAHYIVMKTLPFSNSGKVDKKSLVQTVFTRPDFGNAYQSPRTDLEKKISLTWEELLRVAPIGITDSFFDLGGNSMLAARATIAMQKLVDAALPSGILYEHTTILDLVPIIQQSRAGATVELEAEIQLDAAIKPTNAFDPSTFQQSAILLTGATGFLGAFLVREFLARQPDLRIYCIVRAADKEEGFRRIRNNLEKYLLWRDEYAGRIEPVAGHLNKERLGLTSRTYNRLARNVDAIYHNGAMVNYAQSYGRHKPANVNGTQHIIAFACEGKTKPVHFLSTVATFGGAGFIQNKATIYENDDLKEYLPSISEDMGYSQSKWVAEGILEIARERGVPVTILRPGFIMGDSTTGVSNTDDYVGRLVKGCLELGAYPDLPNQSKEFVPVDYVAKAVVDICADPKKTNQAYHLVPPLDQVVDINDFFGMMTSTLGYELDKLPYTDWTARLIKSGGNNTLTPFLPRLTEKVYKGRTIWELYENMSALDSTNAQRILGKAGITYPVFGEQLVRTYFTYWVESGFISAAPIHIAVARRRQAEHGRRDLEPSRALQES